MRGVATTNQMKAADFFRGIGTSKKAQTRKATIGSCNDVKSRELDDAVDFIENPSIEMEKVIYPYFSSRIL